tara:strand:+ start:265 stop:552 length:288 start_codon:yes stop_codon:yes gene_type:complete
MSSSVYQNDYDMNVQKMENLTPLQQMYKVLTFHETRLHNIESRMNELQKTLTSVDEQLVKSSHELKSEEDETNLKNKTSKTQGKKNKQVKLEITE